MNFDSKYTTILKLKNDEYISEKIEWLNNNSIGSIEIKTGIAFTNPEDSSLPWYAPAGLQRNTLIIYIGFEKDDDATFFKIKYSI